jgi:hypothetical protein
VGDPVAADDVDGDGDLDVITRDSGTGSFRLQRNQGGFPFLSFTDEFLADLPETYAALSLGDLDGDGDRDVLVNSSSGNRTELFENVAGSFVAGPVLTDDDGNSGFWILPAQAADMDGDGLTDIATVRRESSSTYGNYGDVLLVYRQVAPWKFEIDGRWWSVAVNQLGDFDGDGDVDGVGAVLLRNRQVGTAAAGVIQQYGAGTPGAGGIAPLLGVSGPVSQGVPRPRAVRGRSGRPVLLAVGRALRRGGRGLLGDPLRREPGLGRADLHPPGVLRGRQLAELPLRHQRLGDHLRRVGRLNARAPKQPYGAAHLVDDRRAAALRTVASLRADHQQGVRHRMVVSAAPFA